MTPTPALSTNTPSYLFWMTLGLCTLLIYALNLNTLTIYQIDQVSHEPWRWITAHFSHFDLGHLILNVTSMGLLAWAFKDIVTLRIYSWTTLLAIAGIDCGLWWKAVNYYAGFSGVFYGVLVGCLCCLSMRSERKLSRLGWLLNVILFARIGVEVFELNPIRHEFAVFHPAHVWGYLGGLIGWMIAIMTQPTGINYLYRMAPDNDSNHAGKKEHTKQRDP